MKKSTYMIIDIAILTLITLISEAASLILIRTAFRLELFTLSIVITMSIILSMRWSLWGVVPATLGGLLFCIIQGASLAQYLVYIGGNAFVAFATLWFIWVKPEKISGSLLLSILFALSGYLAVLVGRTLFSLFIEVSIQSFMGFLISDLLNIGIGLLIIAIARRQKGLFESQEIYLSRLAAEEKGEEK